MISNGILNSLYEIDSAIKKLNEDSINDFVLFRSNKHHSSTNRNILS